MWTYALAFVVRANIDRSNLTDCYIPDCYWDGMHLFKLHYRLYLADIGSWRRLSAHLYIYFIQLFCTHTLFHHAGDPHLHIHFYPSE